MPEAFSQSWASAWCEVLNRSEEYRAAASAWEGSVALVVRSSESESRLAVFLDLHRGACRGARQATTSDLDGAAFVLEGDRPAWKDLFAGAGSPAMALLSGQLRLVKGDLARLLPLAGAAKELMQLARSVETTFPEWW